MRDISNHRKRASTARRFSLYGFAMLLGLLVALAMNRSCDTTINQVFLGEDVITIAEYLEDNQETYSRFWELLLTTNLKSTLSAYNPHGNDDYTLFMPSDEAFQDYIEENQNYNTFDDLLNDTDFANLLIRYHLVNRGLETNDFPFGALPDTTATGDLLTIGFDTSQDTTVYRINNVAPVIQGNIELINGYIHIIGKVLEPINYSSYDWVDNNPDFSIFADALALSHLKDTMGVYRTNTNGDVIRNKYTLFAEPDSVFAKDGIHNIDDLVARFESFGLESWEEESEFYQYVAYHILEGTYFLDNFEDLENFNTYANFMVQVDAGLEIKLNPGIDTIDVIIQGQDTTIINYVRIMMDHSNILTKNGAIHLLQDLLKVKNPGRTTKTFQFYEENAIDELRNVTGEHVLDLESMEWLYWEGIDYFKYVKSASSISATNNDYLEVTGNFTIEYTIPKVLPGKYEVRIKSESSDSENATIQVYLDGNRLGSSFDLTTGGNPYNSFAVGNIEFLLYEPHVLKITSLIPGIFIWDFVQFVPN